MALAELSIEYGGTEYCDWVESTPCQETDEIQACRANNPSGRMNLYLLLHLVMVSGCHGDSQRIRQDGGVIGVGKQCEAYSTREGWPTRR